MFEAARDVLPTVPDIEETGEGEADRDNWERFKQAYEAWTSMWRQVLAEHPRRHRELVAWAAGTDAERVICEELLGGLPWAVESALLAELARADLERFSFQVLTAQGCRMRRDGSDEQQVLDHFAADLSALTDEEQMHFRHSLNHKSATLMDMGCRAPVSWVQRAALGTWRHLLNPTQARNGYTPVHWQASTALLNDLAAQFARTAARAMPYWEPQKPSWGITPREVTWVRSMVLHIPVITEDLKAGIRPIVRDARERLNRHAGLHSRFDERSELQEILSTIERVLADPPAAFGADRGRTALGASDKVTVRDLGHVQTPVLNDYLDRHCGNDSLVEKALLSCAASGYRSSDDIDNMLRRHSTPDTVLLHLTERLRTKLGGGPAWRETWTQLVLGRETVDLALVRALPAWSALRARGEGHATAHPAVVTAVREALGTDQDAWDRFATCPATNSGPTAWLRLGDLLDAAAAGDPWPKPPSSR
ncbi:hypothetical protein [Streptomyces niveus]